MYSKGAMRMQISHQLYQGSIVYPLSSVLRSHRLKVVFSVQFRFYYAHTRGPWIAPSKGQSTFISSPVYNGDVVHELDSDFNRIHFRGDATSDDNERGVTDETVDIYDINDHDDRINDCDKSCLPWDNDDVYEIESVFPCRTQVVPDNTSYTAKEHSKEIATIIANVSAEDNLIRLSLTRLQRTPVLLREETIPESLQRVLVLERSEEMGTDRLCYYLRCHSCISAPTLLDSAQDVIRFIDYKPLSLDSAVKLYDSLGIHCNSIESAAIKEIQNNERSIIASSSNISLSDELLNFSPCMNLDHPFKKVQVKKVTSLSPSAREPVVTQISTLHNLVDVFLQKKVRHEGVLKAALWKGLTWWPRECDIDQAMLELQPEEASNITLTTASLFRTAAVEGFLDSCASTSGAVSAGNRELTVAALGSCISLTPYFVNAKCISDCYDALRHWDTLHYTVLDEGSSLLSQSDEMAPQVNLVDVLLDKLENQLLKIMCYDESAFQSQYRGQYNRRSEWHRSDGISNENGKELIAVFHDNGRETSGYGSSQLYRPRLSVDDLIKILEGMAHTGVRNPKLIKSLAVTADAFPKIAPHQCALMLQYAARVHERIVDVMAASFRNYTFYSDAARSCMSSDEDPLSVDEAINVCAPLFVSISRHMEPKSLGKHLGIEHPELLLSLRRMCEVNTAVSAHVPMLWEAIRDIRIDMSASAVKRAARGDLENKNKKNNNFGAHPLPLKLRKKSEGGLVPNRFKAVPVIPKGHDHKQFTPPQFQKWFAETRTPRQRFTDTMKNRSSKKSNKRQINVRVKDTIKMTKKDARRGLGLY